MRDMQMESTHGTACPEPLSFSHFTRGTCVPGCTSYGECHCGCGSRPKVSRVSSQREHRVAGRPFTFVPGHQMRVASGRAGMWSRNGVGVERIRPLVFWLRDRHGSIRAVATLLRMPEGTIRGYVYNTKRKRVPPDAAKRIVALVLAHRRRVRPLEMSAEEPALRPVLDPSVRRGVPRLAESSHRESKHEQ
jgi:hypothetical protein